MINGGDQAAISRMFSRFRKESESIVKSAMQFVYYMRGAVQYHDALLLSPAEMDIGFEFIDERLSEARKMEHPVF